MIHHFCPRVEGCLYPVEHSDELFVGMRVGLAIATLLPFFAQPDRHMFLKPGIAQQAEERLGFHLNYQPTPNWRTYAQLLSLSEVLFEQLKPLGARDYIDVQSFMWIASKPEEPGTSPKPK